jgi:hypothetical protein
MVRLTLCALALAFSAGVGMADDAVSEKIYLGSVEYHLAARNALVVGVSSLKDGNGFADLKNPEKDALAVTAALRKIGFAVMSLNEVYKPEQLTRQNIKLALYDFARVLQSVGGVGLIYFSGHGVERDGQMYLAPYDAYVRFERDLSEELIPIRLFYDAVQYANNPLNLFVIDACRDNPWTKPLEQFGLAYQSRSTPASENVILANSTLSGSKSPDGAGDRSPYADAFVLSLDQADENLSGFFGAIGGALHRLRRQHPEMPVPTIQQPTGREFVFVPTLATYNREQSIYKIATNTGNRDVLEQLTWKYSGGYFYKAAKSWLEHAPLAPANPLPANVIQLQKASEFRAAPSSKSTILETRSAGTRLVATALSDQKQYVAVATGWKQEPAFVRANQVRIAPVKIARKLLNISFKDSPETGVDLLSDESVSQMGALSKEFAPLLTRIDIIGYEYVGTASVQQHALRLLLRQAGVVEALSNIGYDSTKIAIRTRKTQNVDEDDLVRIQFNGSSLPEKNEFQNFSAEAFIKAQETRPDLYVAGGIGMESSWR